MTPTLRSLGVAVGLACATAFARAPLAQRADAKDVRAVAADGTTALHRAVDNDDRALMATLLEAGADPKARNRHGVTPLHLAATNGDAAIVEALIAAGAEVDAATPGGETPLMFAARTGDPATVRALVAHGAQVNAKENWRGQTPLMWAAVDNNADAIRVLVAAGANLNATSTSGSFTAFLFAVRGGQQDAARALLDAGADPNEQLPDGMSALVLAVYNGHYECASLLLNYGADATAAKQGWTALHQLAWSRRPNRGFNMPGAVPTGRLDSLDLARKLVEYGADLNARLTKEPRDGNRNMLNRIGGTAFLMAAKADDVPLMRVLLAAGVDPKIKTNDGTSAVMAAAGVGVYGPGESPGTAEEAFEAVKLAYEAGAGDVNDANRDGETAMLGAVYRGGAVPVIQFLADKGARLDVENKKHWSPLFAAEGVVYASSGIRRYPEAAALIRKLMRERNLPIPDIELNGGATPIIRNATSTAPIYAKTTADGVFTDAQAQRGQQVYQRACAVCHLDTLQGDAVSPPLVGPGFMGRFTGLSAHEMIQNLRASMPQNAPDSLGDRAYIDLTTFLLRANGARSGAAELPLDISELEKIAVTAK